MDYLIYETEPTPLFLGPALILRSVIWRIATQVVWNGRSLFSRCRRSLPCSWTATFSMEPDSGLMARLQRHLSTSEFIVT